MRNLCAGFLSCCVILGLAACGGGGGGHPTPTPTPTPSLTVSPSSATVALGATQQFSATSGVTPVTATWSVNGVQGGNSTVGTIDGTGKYTGPATFPSPNAFMVTANASGASGNANLTVAYPNDNHLSQSRPVKLGTTGGNSKDFVNNGTTVTCCSGTLGSLIIQGGNFFILSNNHVLDKSSFGTLGDPIGQPGLVDNNCNAGAAVATLSQAAALKPSPCTGVCTGPAPSNVDAALAQIVSSATVDTGGNILDLGAAGPSSIAAAPPSLTNAVPSTVLSSNEGVAKSGRSTGLTCSTLSSVTTTVSVDYNSSCGGAKAFTATFTNQIIINGATFSASGDSGSLVVTSDTARPVGLLFAGNSTSTTANTIADLMTAFGSFTFAGGADHSVSCDATATASSVSKTVGASSASLSTEESERVTAARDKYASYLYANTAVRDVSIGGSVDNPQEGAVVITVHGSTAIPALVDNVRTRVVYEDAPAPRASVADINRAAAIQQAHAPALMKESGIQGVGVGVSDDNTAETALVIYVITGMPHPEIPAVIDGLRTKIIEGDRFRAFGWGHETRPSACSQKQQPKNESIKSVQKLP